MSRVGAAVGKACGWCGVDISGMHGTALYCSPRCRTLIYKDRRKVRRVLEFIKCETCETEMTNPRRQRNQMYCSQRCGTRASHLRKYYGITPNEYRALLAAQGGCCAICRTILRASLTVSREGKWWDVAIDHDHATGAVRGLLCSGCNKGLGNFADDIDRLRSAIAYLTSNASTGANAPEEIERQTPS